jgi:putrescine transport system ATP-binding protein
VALRPERIRLLEQGGARPPANAASGVLRDLAYRGEGWVALVALSGGQVLRVVLPGAASPPSPGSLVTLAWAAKANIPLGD